jgi:hypothetical protein
LANLPFKEIDAMQYLLLIYSDEKADAAAREKASEDEQKAMMGEWFKYTEDLKKAGVYVGGDALQPTATATTVRERNGKAMTTDGPFAETKEQLGGYYLVDCKDLDEALVWAGKCPGAKNGSIEVRPIMRFD